MIRAWTVPSAYSAADPWPAALLTPKKVEQRATTEASWTMMDNIKWLLRFSGTLTLFDVRMLTSADKPGIYICRAEKIQLRLSPGSHIHDWKVQSCFSSPRPSRPRAYLVQPLWQVWPHWMLRAYRDSDRQNLG